jgi:hypothetical protein
MEEEDYSSDDWWYGEDGVIDTPAWIRYVQESPSSIVARPILYMHTASASLPRQSASTSMTLRFWREKTKNKANSLEE